MSTLVSNPYPGAKAIKQHHRNGCWAACLEWYSRCVLGCTGYTQDGIRKDKGVKAMYKSNSVTGAKYSTGNAAYGTLETEELRALFESSPWCLATENVQNFNSVVLQNRLKYGPVLVGYYDLSGNTWHVNVVVNYDADLDMVLAMEPKSGKYMDKAMADLTVSSPFNILAWRF